MKDKHSSTQPIRLVLINSGTFEYADVDLTKVAHFVAKNNLGKTSLMATLQFLYVADQRKHKFPTKQKETRKHYFPTDRSYIIFECRTGGGRKTIVFRGEGELNGYKYEKMIYSGPFKKELFLDESEKLLIREPVETKQEIVKNGYEITELTNRDHRAVLRGTSEKLFANLGLIPSANTADYQQFCDLYVNLLQMSDLRQDHIEEQFINVYEKDLSTKIVSLYEHSEEWESILEKQRELKIFNAQKSSVEAVLENWDEYREDLKSLSRLWPELKLSYQEKLKNVSDKLQGFKEQIEAVNERIKKHEQKKTTIYQQQENISEKIGMFQVKKQELNDKIEKFKNFDENFVRQQVKNIKRNIRRKQSALDRSLEKTVGEYETIIKTKKKSLNKIKTKLKNYEHSVFYELNEKFSRKDLQDLFSIFNSELLSLSTKGDHVDLEDNKKLKKRLEEFIKFRDDQVWKFEFGDISLKSPLISRPEIESFSDKKLLQESVKTIYEEINNNQKKLERLKQKKQIEQEIEKNEGQLEGKQEKLHEFQKFKKIKPRKRCTELREQINQLNEEKKNLRKKGKEVDAEIRSSHDKLNDLEYQKKELHARCKSVKKSYKVCQELFESLPENVRNETSSQNVNNTSYEFDYLVKKLENLMGVSIKQQKKTIERYLSQLRKILPDYQIKGASSEQVIKLLREKKEAFELSKEDLRREWQASLTSLASASENILESLEVLKRKVNVLNRRINQQQVSNLEHVKLIFERRTEKVEAFKNTIQMGKQEQNLFQGRGDLKGTIDQLQKQARAQMEIKIKDLFGLTFEVKKKTGEVRKYRNLQDIQSRGTTITIKILFGLILLNGLLEIKPKSDLKIPFLIDEVLQLDSENIWSIRELSDRLHFIPFFNGTTEIEGTDIIYLMKTNDKGKVYLGDEYKIVIERHR